MTTEQQRQQQDVLAQKYTDLLESWKRQLLQGLEEDGVTTATATATLPPSLTSSSSSPDFLQVLLMRYTCLFHATPSKMAEFVLQGCCQSSSSSSSEEEQLELLESKTEGAAVERRSRLVDRFLLMVHDDEGATITGNSSTSFWYWHGPPPSSWCLLKEVLLSDGPSDGNYGRFLQIYNEIVQLEEEEEEEESGEEEEEEEGGGLLVRRQLKRRLAVAVALVHATPVKQTNAKSADVNAAADSHVDPVARYLNYREAFLEGQLDPCFSTLTTFELTFVVDGDEPDDVAHWGRRMLRNYRPDHVLTDNGEWRYVNIVRSDVRYTPSGPSHDSAALHKYQNILMNGGVCGRRAFFGRFILRAFGIPTTARPSPGHGALCHLCPPTTTNNNTNRWCVNLGGRWGCGTTKTRNYRKDLDFLSTTQARTYDPSKYWSNVKICQLIGNVWEEQPIWGVHDPLYNNSQNIEDGGNDDDQLKKNNTNQWYKLSLRLQQEIIDAGPQTPQIKNTTPLSQVKATTTTTKNTIAQTVGSLPESPNARTVQYLPPTGRIVIPAAAYDNPQRQTKHVHVMKSFVVGVDDGNYNTRTPNSNTNSSSRRRCGGLQIYLPPFMPQGLSVLKGGAWNQDESTTYSGWRIKSGGYGKYCCWGFRLAIGLGGGQGSGSSTTSSGLSRGNIDDEDEVEDNNGAPTTSHKQEFTLQIPDTDESIEFVYIKPGSFVMGGDLNGVDGRFSCIEGPHHNVRITRGFYLGKYPVTQAQYQACLQQNPSKSTKQPNCPVDNIGEDDCTRFCDKLTEVAGRDVRLPTEAEWEYACRAGTTTKWFFGDDPSPLEDYAWCKSNSGLKSHPVGLKKPNPWGLYDIYGQVLERCSDRYSKDYFSTPEASMDDPTGPSDGIMSLMEYKIKIPSDGSTGSRRRKYKLSAKVCTMNYGQRLMVAVGPPHRKGRGGGGGEVTPPDGGIPIKLPFTLGEWKDFGASGGGEEGDDTVILDLVDGEENSLCVWRDKPPQFGISIKEFVLTPAIN